MTLADLALLLLCCALAWLVVGRFSPLQFKAHPKAQPQAHSEATAMFSINPAPTFLSTVNLTVPGSDSPAALQITWRHQGPLPTGVTFSNGILSGTPTQAGIFVYNVSATGGVSGAYRTYTYWLGVQPEGWTPG